ncbi:hypothetical protein DH86_00000111 [Scytalidium sp. 3C]|nr:hypothetical protein DH86_00000111 [Scytalidium sp. 3C]
MRTFCAKSSRNLVLSRKLSSSRIVTLVAAVASASSVMVRSLKPRQQSLL